MKGIKYLSKTTLILIMILSILFASATTCFAADSENTQISDQNYYLGDANLDGSITLVDVTSIQRHLADLIHLQNKTAMELADIDIDGSISMLDVTHIQRFLANLACPEGIGEIFTFDTQTTDKTLIVYFSWSNNTETMANYIHDQIGGDIQRIEPVTPYPEDYNETADKAKAQRDNDERPKFKTLQYNPEEYDTIFIALQH